MLVLRLNLGLDWLSLVMLNISFLQTGYGNDLYYVVCGVMIGFSSYAGVMENLKNSTEEQKPEKQESSKNQKAKPVGGFVLVHAGKPLNCNQQQCSYSKEILKSVGFIFFCCLHVGAGYHSESKAKEYKHVCKRACQRVCFHDKYLLIIDNICI